MEITYPLHFTKRGRGWRKSQISVTLEYNDGTSVNTGILDESHLKRGDFTIAGGSVNGYCVEPDTDEKIRITNIIGGQNGVLLKECPHCGEIKPLAEFDYSGRFTGEQRDQSNCNDCRGNY